MAEGKATTTLKQDDGLKTKREAMRDSFIQEAMESWKTYRETGVHMTGAAIDAWLATWGTDDPTEPRITEVRPSRLAVARTSG